MLIADFHSVEINPKLQFVLQHTLCTMSPTEDKSKHLEEQELFQRKPVSFDNPCAKEQDRSFRCLSESGYDKDRCTLAFANYKACKEFWGRVRSERRSKGIYPYMPGLEERKKIKAEYMKQ